MGRHVSMRLLNLRISMKSEVCWFSEEIEQVIMEMGKQRMSMHSNSTENYLFLKNGTKSVVIP